MVVGGGGDGNDTPPSPSLSDPHNAFVSLTTNATETEVWKEGERNVFEEDGDEEEAPAKEDGEEGKEEEGGVAVVEGGESSTVRKVDGGKEEGDFTSTVPDDLKATLEALSHPSPHHDDTPFNPPERNTNSPLEALLRENAFSLVKKKVETSPLFQRAAWESARQEEERERGDPARKAAIEKQRLADARRAIDARKSAFKNNAVAILTKSSKYV